jgi:hypothetical protein
MKTFIRYAIIFILIGQIISVSNAQHGKPRTIITTDGEIDDVDSFIRMLLYTNEFKTEGLVISSSQWHYAGDGKGTLFTSEMDYTKRIYGSRTDLRWPGTNWIHELITEYGKVQPNLAKHDQSFPTAAYLKSLVKIGNIEFEGEMAKDTEGSNFLMAKLLDNNLEPLYLQVWGGTNTIARALKAIEDKYKGTSEWNKIYNKICNKVVIYAILDQDATYRKYIKPNWPNVKLYYNSNQFWCFAYPWKQSVPSPLQYSMEGTFMGEHIINNHGPLLKKYYSYGDGQQQAGDPEHTHGNLEKANEQGKEKYTKYDFISEGDSPAYFHLIDVGLQNLENPHFGGWGGRLVQSDSLKNRWEDGEKAADYNPFLQKTDKTYPQTRWVETLQKDFAARADWCVKDFKNANHPPKVYALGPNKRFAKVGQKVVLKVKATDPDKNKLSYHWWQYHEVDSIDAKVTFLKGTTDDTISVQVPTSALPGNTIHIIAEVSDNGVHSLTRYQRFIIIVQ